MKDNLISLILLFSIGCLFVGVHSQMIQATHRNRCTSNENVRMCQTASFSVMFAPNL